MQTYTLVENPNTVPVTVEVSYLTPGREGNVVFTDTLRPNTRKTCAMRDKIKSGRASVMVTSQTPGKGVVVERAMYSATRRAGTDTIGAYVDQ